jgi:CYTH domain-containing protein
MEIERKFLVKSYDIPNGSISNNIVQGYIFDDGECSSRIRIKTNDNNQKSQLSVLTIKKKISDIKRHEYEFDIPIDKAIRMLDHICKYKLTKTRYVVDYDQNKDLYWEIDVFDDENKGLVIAEIELRDENYPIVFPSWIEIETEVTNDPKYLNSNLAKNPYGKWSKDLIYKAKNLYENGKIDESFRLVFDYIDELLRREQFFYIDHFISDLNIGSIQTDILLVLLTATNCAKSKLNYRRSFYEKCEAEIIKRGECEENLLFGLK